MQKNTYSLDGVEWSGWPCEQAVKGREPRARYDGYIYVIEFTDGWIKVGCSNNARTRMTAHAKDAHLRDAKITRVYISEPHKEWRANEVELVAFCRQQQPTAVNGHEYFRGLTFRKVAGFAAQLRQDRTTAEEFAAYEAQAEAFLRGFEGFRRRTEPAPQSAMQQADAVIGDLFVALAGSKETLDAEASDAGRAEELWDVASHIAEQRGCCIECVLENNSIDLLENALITMVQTYARRLLTDAREQGIESLTMSIGDAIKAGLPADDQRFASDPELVGFSEDGA